LKYYYEKYSVYDFYRQARVEASSSINDVGMPHLANDFGFNSETGAYFIPGTANFADVLPNTYGEGYKLDIPDLLHYYYLGNSRLYFVKHRGMFTSTKGDFIETIIAENGTYPDDGQQDIYWYIKKYPVMSNIFIATSEHKLQRLPLLETIETNKLKRRFVYQKTVDNKLKKL